MEKSFKSILPKNASSKVKAAELSLWEARRKYEDERNAIFKFENLGNYKTYDETTPDKLFDAFALSLGLDVWDSNGWSVETKRNLLGKILSIKRQRGTVASFKTLFDAVGLNSEIVEWWQDDYLAFERVAKPFDFKVVVSTKRNDIFQIELRRYDLRRIVHDLAPLKATFEILIESNIEGSIGIACGGHVYKVIEVATTFDRGEG